MTFLIFSVEEVDEAIYEDITSSMKCASGKMSLVIATSSMFVCISRGSYSTKSCTGMLCLEVQPFTDLPTPGKGKSGDP